MKHRILQLIIILCVSTIQTSLVAQKNNHKTGLTFSSFGTNNIVGTGNDDRYIYKAKSFYTLGVTYVRGLNKWFDIETGIEYSYHKIGMTTKNFPGINMFVNTQSERVILLNVPITVRANFLKYLFVNIGTIVDIDCSRNIRFNNQTGIGAIAGIGLKYDFDFGLSLFVNPYIKAHSWVDAAIWQKILEKGFRTGITYDINRIIKKR